MKFGQFMKYHKIKICIENSTKKCGLQTCSRTFGVYKELIKFSEQADYIGWVTATLSKYIKISIETSSNSFLQRILKKQKKELKLVSRPCFS